MLIDVETSECIWNDPLLIFTPSNIEEPEKHTYSEEKKKGRVHSAVFFFRALILFKRISFLFLHSDMDPDKDKLGR